MSSKTTKKGKRYTAEQKRKILEFIDEVNAEKGRGGQSAAAKKFGVTTMTLSNWQKSGGAESKKPGPKPKTKSVPKTRKLALKRRTMPAPKAKPGPKPGRKATPRFGPDAPIERKLGELQKIHQQITSAKADLDKLKERFESLKAGL